MSVVPATHWLKTLRREDLRGDLFAGITVAVMLVPQGMAYAMLAGLPPVVGLYASTLPLILYAVFGTSRHLAVGPVAMISLLVFAGCSRLAEPGSSSYFSYVLLLSFMVGVFQLALGLLRMGFLVNFVSHAAISGFTSAAAIVIFLSQLKHLLGIDIGGAHSTVQILSEVIGRIGETNPATLGIGMGSLMVLFLLKKIRPRFPAALPVVVAGILLVYFLRLDRAGVNIVGKVPRGLPGISIPRFQVQSMISLFPTALTILFVGFMESIAVAELIASRERYRIFPNRELASLGLANLAAAFFSGYPVTGGFSRTAVNYQAGARTPLASVITALLILLTLLVLTPLFYYLPSAVLAAVIAVAVLGLVNLKEAVRLYRVKKTDAATLFITFLLTLVLGIEKGIICGVLFSLGVFIWRSSHPHTAELGFLEKEGVFRNVKRFPDASIFPGYLILRIDASLYFANMAFIEDCLRHALEERPDLECVIFDLSGVNDMDAVAAGIMEELMEQYSNRGIRFLFAGMKGPVRDLVARAGWREKYGDKIEHLSIEHALKHCQVMSDQGTQGTRGT